QWERRLDQDDVSRSCCLTLSLQTGLHHWFSGEFNWPKELPRCRALRYRRFPGCFFAGMPSPRWLCRVQSYHLRKANSPDYSAVAEWIERLLLCCPAVKACQGMPAFALLKSIRSLQS